VDGGDGNAVGVVTLNLPGFRFVEECSTVNAVMGNKEGRSQTKKNKTAKISFDKKKIVKEQAPNQITEETHKHY